jgi:hypothetical protein
MVIEIIFLISFGIIWKLYGYSKYVGLYLAVATFFVTSALAQVNDYKTAIMIKTHLLIFTALCIFTGIIYQCTRTLINQILTWLIRLNIGILFFAIDNALIQGLLLFAASTTPYMIASDAGILLRSSFINKDLWVILTCIILLLYYTSDVDFITNNSYYLVLLAIIIPSIMHFTNNKYLEPRLLLLCLCIIFDVFNDGKDVLKIILDSA